MKTPYFPVYANDELADTGCLSLEERGAYMWLRCHAWKNDPVGTLPDDDEELARLAGVTLAKWQEIKPGAMRLFKRGNDGRWHHSGLRQAFEKARQKSKAGQASAKKRWEGGRGSDGNASAMRSHTDGNGLAQPEQSMSEVRSHSQRESTRARGDSSPPQSKIVEGPNDDFDEPLPEREWSLGERFILKACELWEKPILETNTKLRLDVQAFGKWVGERVNPNEHKGGRPEWFREWWFQVLNRTITPKPEYVVEHWENYDRWLMQTYETHRA